MRKIQFIIFYLLLFSSNTSACLNILVTILPQQYFINQLVGAEVCVYTLNKAGRNPENFYPKIRDIEKMLHSQLFFNIEVGPEKKWLQSIRQQNRKLQIIYHHQNKQINMAFDDAHYWTDPSNAIIMVHQMSSQLIHYLPELATKIRLSTAQFVIQLKKLDTRIQTLFAPHKNKYFLVYHPAWGAFASHYDVHQVAIETQGKSPNAKQLSQTIALAKKRHLHILFLQPQVRPHFTAMIASELQAKQVVIDPLAYNYIRNLWAVAQQIRASF